MKLKAVRPIMGIAGEKASPVGRGRPAGGIFGGAVTVALSIARHTAATGSLQRRAQHGMALWPRRPCSMSSFACICIINKVFVRASIVGIIHGPAARAVRAIIVACLRSRAMPLLR